MEPADCARVLEAAGLIILTPDRQHYTETDKARQIAPDQHEMTFKDALIFELLRKETENEKR